MKLRTVCTTFAMALAACAVSPSLTSADEAVQAQQQNLSINDQVAQLQADVAEGEFSCVELSARIDNVVEQIDDLLDAGAENGIELLKLRKLALNLRLQAKCDHSGDENGTMLASSSCNCGGHGGGTTIGHSGGFSSSTYSAGGAGGGSGGGGGGFGTIAALGGIAAAIAIPIAVSDGDEPGDGASPSF